MPKNDNTIFMIHGMWGSGWMWHKYSAYFEERGYKCVAPSLPYHDVDPKVPAPDGVGGISLLEYADFLEKEVDKLDSPPIIMGHSMGGLLAQIVAARGYGKGLLLLAPAASADIFAFRPSVFKIFLKPLLRWGFWKKPLFISPEMYRYAILHRTPEEEHNEIINKLVQDSGRATAQMGFPFLDRSNASSVDEKKIKVPMLIVVGKEDRIVPASVVRKIAKKYDGIADYKEFDNHAHHLIGETGWEDVAGYIYSWIKLNVK